MRERSDASARARRGGAAGGRGHAARWRAARAVALGLLLGGPGRLPAQSVNLGDGALSIGPGGPPRTADALPAPAALPGALEMQSLSYELWPGDFYLLTSQSNRYGPFRYVDGSAVGSAQNFYRLRVIDPAHFRLEPPDGAGAIGPFPYSNGVTIAFDRAQARLARAPSRIEGALLHPDGGGRQPEIALGVLDGRAQQELVRLRAALAQAAARLAQDTAPLLVGRVPVVRWPSGHATSPWVQRSESEQARAWVIADARADRLLDAFHAACLPFRATADRSGSFAFPAVPPGRYLLCARLTVRAADATAATPSTVAIWWTTLTAGAHDRLLLSLSPGNACHWSQIFPADR